MSPAASPSPASEGAGHFTLLYFAAASSFTGKAAESLPAPLPARQLFDALERRYAGITAQVLRSCLLTVNQEYVELDEEAEVAPPPPPSSSSSPPPRTGVVIQPGDEVAIIPPVSSG